MNGQKSSKVFSYDYEIGDIGTQAYDILINAGFNVVCKCCLNDKDIILCDNWGNDFIKFENI